LWSALSVEETRVLRENHSTATLWWSALSVEETRVSRENYSFLQLIKLTTTTELKYCRKYLCNIQTNRKNVTELFPRSVNFRFLL
jgi:hypothetical protein